jgi:hypothetical protein
MILTTTDSIFRRAVEKSGELTDEEMIKLRQYDASILNSLL